MQCAAWSATARALVVLVATTVCAGLTLARVALAGVPACPGDCANQGSVTIGDLVTGVNIALGSLPVSACSAMDGSGDGTVTIDELVRAVTAALDGCPTVPTVTESPPATDTATATAADTATETIPPTTPPTPAPPTPTQTPIPTMPEHFCDLPGSVQSTVPGLSVVPGGPAGAPDVSFIHLPIGFCAHYFANVGNPRQLRFAPGGELFVASPSYFTTSNGPSGVSAILVMPDDDHDGTADQVLTFMSGMQATVGLLFTNGYLYYQDTDYTGSPPHPGPLIGTKIMRRPYTAGERTPSGSPELVADITIYSSNLHWPKTLDITDDGTIYVGNGGDEGERTAKRPLPDPCDPTTRPFHGGILKLDGSPGGAQVAKGFRNPIAVRCLRGHNQCFAVELARDFSTSQGGREKLVPIRQGDDWGFPCCGTKDQPYTQVRPDADCSGVASEIGSFIIGHTPFDVDYETGKWPDPWGNRAYLPLHGAYGTWQGARVVGIGIDEMTGQVLPGSDLSGTSSGAMADFATGWDDGKQKHGRPTNVAFAPDGRLFLGNDTSGDIIWIAPMSLPTGATASAAAQP